MKKLLSVLLVITTLTLVCCMSVSADIILTPEDDLWYLQFYTEDYLSSTGMCKPHDESDRVLENALDNADAVIGDKNATDEDYLAAYDTLMFAVYNRNLYMYYIEGAYELSLKEQNYNNWYSEEDWSNFAEKRDALGEAIETERLTKANEAFYDMLYAYNVMTNRYTLKGDINKDGEVNVADATLLQKYLVGTAELTGAQKMLTSAYDYEDFDITAATTIQKYSVGLISEMPNNEVFLSDYETPESDERITERAFNFIICPRTSDGLYHFRNGYYDTEFLQTYYRHVEKDNK